jgi:hypothetical protein
MSYVFTFKKKASKQAVVHTFIGTWKDFESKFPDVIIVSPAEPVVE